MRLTAYKVTGHEMPIRPAPFKRHWMDASESGYAYRCLPLTIANQFGWEILCPQNVSAEWNGGPAIEDIALGDDHPHWLHSHFGMGIITFSTPYLFRTPPGWEILITGPVNYSKPGISPLEGIVETSWSPYSFTINWSFTQARRVTFCEGDPLCRIVPIPEPGYLECFEPEILGADKIPKPCSDVFEAWDKSRGEFIKKLLADDPDTVKQGWQKVYVKGAAYHRLHVQPFKHEPQHEPS